MRLFVFHTLSEIIDIIRSRKTPTPKTYRQWDEYARSFYLKMCTCFGVDYQHLEATPPQQETHPVPKGKSYMDRLAEVLLHIKIDNHIINLFIT
ncbi:hypothetical protein HanRHA438_Chr04g0195121 [Helianthus annuus]|uniref:Uncharacterized protein n=1 Tax=Helianthus annuus TaxID=4232 RepID=A0A9K3NT13_HELAN|nr:hypothetical protein HanXRQr2_Chr04g0185351 [Helianthus annuus]KAJ0582405.1 hypothetical protein HanHA300_Chr04g0151891 [Helianthus annuus]KAJ0762648.1 hypothetical protein HanOQP8_Chr04g0163671 [Helianthus annuus]KAJ0928530.1 hypothetical protein HanRHA438_Chr04g0195121 [Helianthus annuus]KAJ0932892.1 hypothetical protein HanPSC8_Chr04g0178901 [Helianthus annuus]